MFTDRKISIFSAGILVFNAKNSFLNHFPQHKIFINYLGILCNAHRSYSLPIPLMSTLPPLHLPENKNKHKQKNPPNLICVAHILIEAWSSSQCTTP